MGRDRERKMSAWSGAAAASPVRPALVATRRPASTASGPATTGTRSAWAFPPGADGGTARFDGISQPWLRDPVKRWSRFRLATGCAFATIVVRGAGAVPVLRRSSPSATRGVTDARRDHPAGPGGLPVLAARPGILGCHPGAVAVDDPGVLRRLPPPRLAARAGRQTPPSTSKSSPSTTTRSPGSSPSS